MAVKIGDQEFRSKVEAKKFIREKFKTFNGEDPFWFALIERHPNKIEKIGRGIARFELSLNPINKESYQLNIKRIDGTYDHVSWIKCVESRENSLKSELLTAMRIAIAAQTQAFKIRSGITACELCKVELDTKFSRHVDHYPIPFRDLAANFLRLNPNHPVDFDSDPLSNAACFLRSDDEFRMKWASYHLNHAGFRILCRECNLKCR